MRIRLDIAYDGTNFRGWATQPGLRTVQGTLEAGLERILGGEVRLVVAGRTDAGVHARGQVAHVDLTDEQLRRFRASARDKANDAIPLLSRRMQGVLGSYSDVTVTRSAEAAPGFDARFSATWRRYEYRLADFVSGYDPTDRLRTAKVRGSLDAELMDATAQTLIGLHDFAAYCKPRERATTIRTLLEFDWHRSDTGVLVANIKADAFCHSMVRSLVGACVAVADGHLNLEDAALLRDQGERTSEFKTQAARGLTLTEVGYPADDQLGYRAELTRRRRLVSDDD